MATPVSIEKFLELGKQFPVIDVRTPAEFEQGHIPGAHNVPLFSNDDRVVVGTLYKQQGREPAILKGLELVGPRLKGIVESVNALAKEKTVLTHCWRGGMRSGSVAWLLETYGYKVYTLQKGYKGFRNLVLSSFTAPLKLTVLGGRTGSGKTLVLQELARQGEQVIDLEKLAHHKGSSYGSLGEKKQPSQEHFENKLAVELMALDHTRNTWLEDESRKIGTNLLPAGLWEQLCAAPLVCIDLSTEARLGYLVAEYGKYSKEELKAATLRIGKKLGGQHVKRAVEAIDQGDLRTAAEISLVYYDKTYDFGIAKREKENVKRFAFETLDASRIAATLRKPS